MTRRLDVLSPVAMRAVDAVRVVAGRPKDGSREVATIAGAAVGVWEMTVGAATDVEQDELFVVLSGSGTVQFDDGDAIELHMGVAVRLTAGDRATWTVRETIRKIYVA